MMSEPEPEPEPEQQPPVTEPGAASEDPAAVGLLRRQVSALEQAVWAREAELSRQRKAADEVPALRAELQRTRAEKAAAESAQQQAEATLKVEAERRSRAERQAAKADNASLTRAAELQRVVEGKDAELARLRKLVEELEAGERALNSQAVELQHVVSAAAQTVAALRAGEKSAELLRASKSGRRALVALARAEKLAGLKPNIDDATAASGITSCLRLSCLLCVACDTACYCT